MKTYIGMNFWNGSKNCHLFTFCLAVLPPNEKTIAFVDFENGVAIRLGITPELIHRRAAILKLATMHCSAERIKNNHPAATCEDLLYSNNPFIKCS